MKYRCSMKCEGSNTCDKPGEWLICGMHLVKVVAFGVPSEPGEDEEVMAFRAMRSKFILAAALSVPILLLSMGELLPGLGRFISGLFSMKTNALRIKGLRLD